MFGPMLALGWTEVGVIAALATAAAAAAGLYVTMNGLRDQLWLQTFAEYTRRYADVVRDLPSESRRPGSAFDIARLAPDEREVVLNSARAYLNLTSEEYFLHSRGRIDDETWSIWRTGIEETVRLPWLRTAWRELEEEYTYVPEFCRFMDRCLHVAKE
jgi:hypothetical protein